MNEIEKHISELPFPDPSPNMDARVKSMLDGLDIETKHGGVAPSISVVNSNSGRLSMSLKIGSIAATLLVAAFVFLSSTGSHSPAFADVAGQARTVESIQYVFKQVYMKRLPTGGVSVLSPETGDFQRRTDVKRVAEEAAVALESDLKNTFDPKKRRELILRIEILRAHTRPEQPLLQHSVRVRAARGGRERRECIFPPYVGDTISNAAQGRQVSLDLGKNKLIVVKQIKVSADGSEKHIEPVRNDVIQGILAIPENGVTTLRDKTIDGKPVIGFRHEKNMNDGRVEKDYWVDPTTRLPVQIESRFYEAGAKQPSIHSIYWDFSFNEPLDDSMFDTNPPPGFTTEKATFRFYVPEETDQ